jgi:uncharacterized protein (TIGR01244 family)
MADMTKHAMSARSLVALALAALFLAWPGAGAAAAQAAASAQAVQQAKPDQPKPDQQGTAETVAGVRNYTKVDATIACGGALTTEAYAALKQAGYKSIVNLRPESEPGANVADERKAAEAAGFRYIHIPFASATPDASKLDDFLKAYAQPENQPMMLHCASGGRASMFWAVKRVMVDDWPVDKAMNELPDLAKNVGGALRTFVLDYFKSHGKTRP